MESKVFSFHSNKLGFVYDPVFQGELFSFSFFKSGIKQTFHIPTSCFKAEFPALRRSSHLLVQSVVCRASQVGLVVKNPPANAGDLRDTGSILGLGRFPWKRAQQPTPVLLPGDSHRQRSLAAYSP